MHANIKCNLVSLNVRGLNNFKKRKSVFSWLEKKKYDMILLQETYSTLDSEKVWKQEWKGPMLFSHGTSKSRGTLILIRNELDFKVVSLKTDNEGRYIILKCLIDDEPVSIVNIYAPNIENEQVKFLKSLDEKLNECNITDGSDLIIGGDWNVTQDPFLDKSGGLMNTKEKSVEMIIELKAKYNLCDPWRIKNPDTKRYTWRQNKPLVQCRLDFWLLSESLYDLITSIDINPSIQSDHSSIVLKLENIERNPRGPSLWKFNASLLNDSNYKTLMKEKLKQWTCEYNFEDKRVKWEILKYEIRKFTISYSKRINQARLKEEKDLEKKLITLEKSLKEGDTLTEYTNTKQRLRELENEKINGMIVRSKVKWHEEGEKSTKYFLGLEKCNAIKKNIRKLKLSNGTICTNQKDILQHQTQYYKNLYSSKVTGNLENNEHIFDGIKTLNNKDKMACEGLLTVQECEQALKTFKANKSPGNDGITAEFYTEFWNEIKEAFIASMNYAFLQKELSSSQKQAVINLIHKKDKDRLKIENWRPISLLNVDYKIATKAITKRLDYIIPKLVDIKQTGFIKGRYLGDTVRTLYDIIDICNLNNESAIFMMVDFEKAFDSLEWEFMLKTLSKMNFGPSLINWVKLFYTDIESCILNNGTTSNYFPIKRGVRQGDPLSAYLFILSVEVMAHSIAKDESIEGIKIGDTEIKLVQYADDTTAILKDTKSVKHFISHISRFKDMCGLKINTSKTEVMKLGANHDLILPENLKFNRNPIKVLGVYLSEDLQKAYNANLSEKMENIKSLLNTWKQRKLTLQGKVLIIKSLAVSQIIHLANLQPFPDEYIIELERLLYNFLWGGKTHKVKKNMIVQNYTSGGQNMVDLKTLILVQKLKWIKLYLHNHNCLWQNTMEKLIKVENLNLLLRSNFKVKKLPQTSDFYTEVLTALESLNAMQNDSNILNEYVFYNQRLIINKQIKYDKELFDAGLWRAKDVYDPRGHIITFDEWKKRGVTHKSFMLWRGLIHKLKTITKEPRINTENIDKKDLSFELKNGEIVDVLNSNSRVIYHKIVDQKLSTTKAMNKYANQYNIPTGNWKNIFKLFRTCLKDNIIKELQYKILHKYIPTNKLLFQMGKVMSNKCSFCEMYVETIEHLFFDCTQVRNIWFDIELKLYLIEKVKISLTVSDILFGYNISSETTFSVNNVNINTVLLYVKNYIWKCKLAGIELRKKNVMYDIQQNTMYVPYFKRFTEDG